MGLIEDNRCSLLIFLLSEGRTTLRAALANNGWIWDGNPRVDFAGKESRAYLRREVIIWEVIDINEWASTIKQLANINE